MVNSNNFTALPIATIDYLLLNLEVFFSRVVRGEGCSRGRCLNDGNLFICALSNDLQVDSTTPPNLLIKGWRKSLGGLYVQICNGVTYSNLVV